MLARPAAKSLTIVQVVYRKAWAAVPAGIAAAGMAAKLCFTPAEGTRRGTVGTNAALEETNGSSITIVARNVPYHCMGGTGHLFPNRYRVSKNIMKKEK